MERLGPGGGRKMTKNNLNFELKSIPTAISVINFYASWYPACSAMNDTFKELSIQFPNLLYFQLEAEQVPELSESFEIDSVPTFIFLKDGKLDKRVEGADAPKLTEVVQYYSTLEKSILPNRQETRATGKVGLKSLINSHSVMIFIKGTPAEPQCGFSSKAVKLLKELNVSFGSFDILSDQDVRQRLKEYSDWPTYPQIYVKGELIGGLDILEELIANGEFQEMVKEESLDEYLQKLISKSNVMLFMKGSPDEPKCGFSRQIVSLLKEHEIAFESFDILSDDQVRQGLKEYSNWPTFPQLYVKGELVGGLDIVKETITDIKNMI